MKKYVEYLIGQNSWGVNAQDNGFFYAPTNYLPFEAWVVNCDIPTVDTTDSSTTGWVAKKYIVDNKTIAPLKLRELPSLSGTVIKVLPIRTTVIPLEENEVVAEGYVWMKVKL